MTMERAASRIKLLETITRAAKGETTAMPAVTVKTHAASPATNTHDRPRDGWFFKALEPGCFLADRWLG